MSTVAIKKRTNFSKLKVGDVISETQYYKVVKIAGDRTQLKNDLGEDIILNKSYLEDCVDVADQYTEEKVVSRTEATQMFLSHPYTAMTVNFNKQVKKEDVVKEIMEAYENSTPKEFNTKAKAAVAKGLGGEERTMVGRHYGHQDEFGRINFIDMNIVKDETKDYDTRYRLVDPRTINWLIVKGVKYKVK
jgi:hypothetical protein